MNDSKFPEDSQLTSHNNPKKHDRSNLSKFLHKFPFTLPSKSFHAQRCNLFTFAPVSDKRHFMAFLIRISAFCAWNHDLMSFPLSPPTSWSYWKTKRLIKKFIWTRRFVASRITSWRENMKKKFVETWLWLCEFSLLPDISLSGSKSLSIESAKIDFSHVIIFCIVVKLQKCQMINKMHPSAQFSA